MFSNTRKNAQEKARQLIAGHTTLIAWWALRHAGVFDAMLKQEAETGEGLNALVHATRTNMAADVLIAMLDYLAGDGLVTVKNDQARLSPEGKALLEHEDGVLELMRAYQPVLGMAEHLLAKLKTYGAPGGGGGGAAGGAVAGGSGGVYRKSEYLVESQAKRFGAEVFPAVRDLVGKHGLTHLLDISCGSGDLLIYLARNLKKVVGVGIGSDAIAVRRANAAITEADLEKRLIAVSAGPQEICTETQRTFDRIGISRQLWSELDCLVATNVYSELAVNNGSDTAASITRTLAATRKNFPKAHLLVIEAVASPRFEKNYYAPEMGLLLRLTRSPPWPPEKWREVIAAARLTLAAEVPLTTDGLTLFLCKSA